MSEAKKNVFQVGNVISHEGSDWTIARFIIDRSVLLQNLADPTVVIRVHTSKLI